MDLPFRAGIVGEKLTNRNEASIVFFKYGLISDIVHGLGNRLEKNMKNTCLYSFFGYILGNVIKLGSDMPEYNARFQSTFADIATEGANWKLAERKKEIWENTKKVLQEAACDEWNMLQELIDQEVRCDLCVACQKCETEYWNALKEVLRKEPSSGIQWKRSFLISEEVKELLRQKERPVDVYIEKYKHRVRDQRNILVMLKGLSSSTPILLNYAYNTNFYSGGGFFLRWNGMGIAVDPGYLFVQNLQNYGLNVLDIDIVIITHEHIDHSSDMRLLDDLHYNVASKYFEQVHKWDEEHGGISRVEQEKHKIKWYMDVLSCEEAVLLSRKGSGFNRDYNQLYCVSMEDDECSSLEETFRNYAEIISEKDIEINEEINLHVFMTAHEQYKEDGKKKFFTHTFGCVLACGTDAVSKRLIGYTSDTSLQPDRYPTMKKLLSQCHIIIANISGIYEDDVLLQRSKERHLGYSGCYKIIKDLIEDEKYILKYLLISEFANQVSDIRFDISRFLQDEVKELALKRGKDSPCILPTEIDLTLDMDTFCAKCSICGRYAPQISVLRPRGENNKMQYVCKECIYSNS